jgi:hypothetical protein
MVANKPIPFALFVPRSLDHVTEKMIFHRHVAARSVWLIVLSTIILLPLIWSVAFGAEFINFANESLAYRYFYSVRLHAGADATAWLPQGQLITALQHIITWQLPYLTPQTFRSSTNAFSIWTIAITSIVAITGLLIAALARRVTWRDRCLLSIVALVPIYALPGALTWIWPDYIALDFALATLCVAAFQYEWQSDDRRPLIRLILYGVLAGTIAANKISMVAIAFPLVALALTMPATPVGVILRALLSGCIAALTFAFWFLAAGMFRPGWLTNMLPHWFAFISNPGGDDGFSVIPYLFTGYGIAALWLAIAFAIVAASARNSRAAVVGTAAFISVMLCVISIWKRPAGTTVGDSALIFLAIGAMLIGISRPSRILTATIALGAVAFLGAAINSAQLYSARSAIIWSKTAGSEQWDFFEKVRKQAAGHPILYFVPNNNYQFGDVFIIALKGSTDFATWNMARTGPAILARIGVNMTFVSEHAFPSGWNEPIPSGVLLVWLNAHWLRPVEDHYPLLSDAKTKAGVKYEVTDLPSSVATGHVVQIP